MESGTSGSLPGRRGWLLRLVRRSQSNGKTRRQETAAWQESRQTLPIESVGAARGAAGMGVPAEYVLPARRAGRDPLATQFAEAFYLMVMASEMRDRAKALGRRYGLETLEMRAEIVRYLERFFGETPPGT
jgi:hypothetical protein